MAIENATFIEFAKHLLWQAPAIARNSLAGSQSPATFRREAIAELNAAERDLDQWIAEGHRIRLQLWAGFRRGENSEVGARFITDMLERYEELRVRDAKVLARVQKSFRREVKQASAISREAGEALKEVDERLLAFWDRELRARLDYALFMRAHRCELDPNSRGGPVFDDPDELGRYLEKVMS